METRERSKKYVPELNEIDEEPQVAEANASGRDGGQQKGNEKTKVNMEMILREIQDFRKENNRQLDDIKDELNKTNQRIEVAEDRIDEAEIRTLMMEQVLRNMLKVQARHEEKLADQEARLRRENIRIYNVPEDEEGGAMITFVETLLKDKLDFSPTKELHIERVHRVPALKPLAVGKPRSIVVKFHRYKTKEVLCKAWEKKEILLNNQRLYFDHDYPATVLSKRKEYNGCETGIEGEEDPLPSPPSCQTTGLL